MINNQLEYNFTTKIKVADRYFFLKEYYHYFDYSEITLRSQRRFSALFLVAYVYQNIAVNHSLADLNAQ